MCILLVYIVQQLNILLNTSYTDTIHLNVQFILQLLCKYNIYVIFFHIL